MRNVPVQLIVDSDGGEEHRQGTQQDNADHNEEKEAATSSFTARIRRFPRINFACEFWKEQSML